MREAKQYASKNKSQEAPTISISEATLWGRLLDPLSAAPSPAVAQYLLDLRFPQADIDRMHLLAEKAREGSLTLEEQIEMDNYERVGTVLSLLKSKARKSLKKKQAGH
jgi:hypothetical protein